MSGLLTCSSCKVADKPALALENSTGIASGKISSIADSISAVQIGRPNIQCAYCIFSLGHKKYEFITSLPTNSDPLQMQPSASTLCSKQYFGKTCDENPCLNSPIEISFLFGWGVSDV